MHRCHKSTGFYSVLCWFDMPIRHETRCRSWGNAAGVRFYGFIAVQNWAAPHVKYPRPYDVYRAIRIVPKSPARKAHRVNPRTAVLPCGATDCCASPRMRRASRKSGRASRSRYHRHPFIRILIPSCVCSASTSAPAPSNSSRSMPTASNARSRANRIRCRRRDRAGPRSRPRRGGTRSCARPRACRPTSARRSWPSACRARCTASC
ncbi:hypothetical protein FEP79_00865 [Burkholderia multivorans]|nr:hypothetical protein [Burkholderia multivorans]MDR8935042.1 hypothetical protein [Burkholderia multivorans]MDR8958512.1 hypothetical protein [Burkholderia multivorans]